MKDIAKVVMISIVSMTFFGYTGRIESQASCTKSSNTTPVIAQIKAIAHKVGYIGNTAASTLAAIWLLQHQEIPGFLSPYISMPANRGAHVTMRGLISFAGLSMLYVTWAKVIKRW
ncbi:MAG TPA: hypothetical protein VGT41_04705 [Candidatus Babeliales bacterium]|nr:hypothetical protein [Candidatus Babeliales bacterium]